MACWFRHWMNTMGSLKNSRMMKTSTNWDLSDRSLHTTSSRRDENGRTEKYEPVSKSSFFVSFACWQPPSSWGLSIVNRRELKGHSVILYFQWKIQVKIDTKISWTDSTACACQPWTAKVSLWSYAPFVLMIIVLFMFSWWSRKTHFVSSRKRDEPVLCSLKMKIRLPRSLQGPGHFSVWCRRNDEEFKICWTDAVKNGGPVRGIADYPESFRFSSFPPFFKNGTFVMGLVRLSPFLKKNGNPESCKNREKVMRFFPSPFS